MNSCFESLEGRMGKNRVREFIPKAGKKELCAIDNSDNFLFFLFLQLIVLIYLV